MHIAQLVSNFHSLPPKKGGAIYQVVDRLAKGMLDRGHQATVFASGDSVTAANLVSVTETETSLMDISDSAVKNYMHLLVSECYARADQFDLIHSHFNLTAAFYARLVGTPTVHTLHSSVTDDVRPFLSRFKGQQYISFSHSQRRQMPELNWIANVYHGIDTKDFPFNAAPDDYLLFMGRLVEEKGAHLAIEAAKAAGENIVIAGRSYANSAYWQEKIEPHIDGKQVKYVGEASNEDKIAYFKNAKALLFPIQWEEPFGLVLIEAMACGTPVIAFDRGSCAEIIRHGETGFVMHDLEGMVDAISRIDAISRGACRERVERLFSLEKMVTGYERVYERVADQKARTKNGNGAQHQ